MPGLPSVRLKGELPEVCLSIPQAAPLLYTTRLTIFTPGGCVASGLPVMSLTCTPVIQHPCLPSVRLKGALPWVCPSSPRSAHLFCTTRLTICTPEGWVT